MLRKRGTVLVFLPGEAEILEVKRELSDKVDQREWDILVLHSRIPHEDIRKVFDRPAHRLRKIILSTNMAESKIGSFTL